MESHQLYSIIVTVTLHELTSTYESAEVVSVRERRGHIHVRETDGVEVYFSLTTVEGVLGDVLLGGWVKNGSVRRYTGNTHPLTVSSFTSVSDINRLIFKRSPRSGAISRRFSSFRLKNTSPSILCSKMLSRMLSEREGISSLRRRRRVVGESPSNLRAMSGGRNRFRPGNARLRDLARNVIGRGRGKGGRREIADGVIWSNPAMAFPCPYCAEAYCAPSEELLMTHIRIVHASDPNFLIQCSLNGCERTFANFRTYQNHRLTHRREVPTVSPAAETEDMDDSVGSSGLEAPSLPQVSTTDMQYFSASDHHSTFLELYPDAQITMKMHSIVHMPRLTKE